MQGATTPHPAEKTGQLRALAAAAAASAAVTLSHELLPCRVEYGLQLLEYASCMCKESNDWPFQVHRPPALIVQKCALFRGLPLTNAVT